MVVEIGGDVVAASAVELDVALQVQDGCWALGSVVNEWLRECAQFAWERGAGDVEVCGVDGGVEFHVEPFAYGRAVFRPCGVGRGFVGMSAEAA